jgi:methylated-DNA-[protein]-cysteine S-methyltransferase
VDFCYWDTPLGRLLLARDGRALRVIRFPSERRPCQPGGGWRERAGSFGDVIEQLQEYFAGRRRTFELPLEPEGTPFQQQVWRALLEIPYGETTSYAALASRIGLPSGTRAVGAANGRNPLPILIPCHRVIGANGKLTGYGGGVAIKARLLALESGARRLVE